MSSSTANRARTAARTDRARSMISAALAPPRLVSASVCLPEMAARAPSDRAKPLPDPGVLDQPGRAQLRPEGRRVPRAAVRDAQGDGVVDDRVGEERSGAPRVGVRRRRAPSPCARAGRGPRRGYPRPARDPPPRRPARGPARRSGPRRRRTRRGACVTDSTTHRAGVGLESAHPVAEAAVGAVEGAHLAIGPVQHPHRRHRLRHVLAVGTDVLHRGRAGSAGDPGERLDARSIRSRRQ